MSDEFNERVRTLASEEIDGRMWGYYYLSWAEEDNWLGGAYVLAYGPVTARLRCSAMGINPGGECMIIRVPDAWPLPPTEYRNRLLNREELLTIDPNAKTIEELKKPIHPKLKDRYPD